MSFKGTCWAWEVARPFDLGPAERLTLLSLGDGANKETGECWYKQETLCDMTGQSRSTIQRALASLAEKGLIRIERAKSEQGFNLACTYHLNLDVTTPMHHHAAAVSHLDLRDQGTTVTPTDASPCCHNAFPGLEEHPASDETPSVRARKAKHLEGFAEFWAAYPLKIKKVNAEKAWAALSKARALPPLPSLLATLVRQIAAEGWALKEKRRFVPHASTWLNGKRWEDEIETPEPERRVLNPPPSPADLAALDLKRAVSEAEKEIRVVIATDSDGWTGKSRSVFFDHLDVCKSEAEVEAHLARCRALCDRLRAMVAFPLRKPAQPGEILPAGGGARIVVDLRDGFIGDALCPACGEDQAQGPCSCGDQGDPAVGGEHRGKGMAPWPECDGSCGWPVTKPVLCGCDRRSSMLTCEHGTPYRYPCEECDDNQDFGHGEDMVGDDTPPEDLAAQWQDAAVAVSPAEPHLYRHGLGDMGCAVCGKPKDAPAHTEALKANKEPAISPRHRRRSPTKVADGQHTYAHNALTGKCARCHQGKDHIRHYLPQELPFDNKEES